jgi:hypothetical protein
VWATVRDRRGVAKARPVLILTATADLRENEAFEAMAVTTTFPHPPPDDHLQLPWHPQGRVSTKLRKRSAAVLSWIVEIDPADIIEFGGDVPVKVMRQILERLTEEET